MLTDFQNSFIASLFGKFAIKVLLTIPPHLEMSLHFLVTYILVSETSDNMKHDGLLGNLFTTNLSLCLLLKEFLKSANV